MDEADNCRRAATEAVADVEPPRLHDLVESVLDDASMIPAVFTIESTARASPDAVGPLERRAGGVDLDRSIVDDDAVFTHAAGVQLIYEGLNLTRMLAHREPWTDDDDAAGETADLEILAADILVARGFYLLARTDAAQKAVQTVQAFGRDQTRRESTRSDAAPATDLAALDANLERDVLELAVLAGAAAVDERPSPQLLSLANDLVDGVGPSFPPVATCLADLPASRSDILLEESGTDRVTSATDH
ncbi:DUF7114 family protein [Natrarchaeobius oligotrophus]|uniref:Polyprenyl synthetase n=1 Tax=Natrarchaeobius chitinivorans TaxID=1679083 RepID=A0A3N6M476_NATCH|nr:hypothetical protein [Natrarchaeobius chitinivorans]RQG98318.1 hypothetical protein EA472_18065 [Natrarchaeobius chitinivorans]